MAYGDSFGGVQGAALAQDRNRASDYFATIAANRAQQAQDAQIAQANRSFMLQQQQLADSQDARQQAFRQHQEDSATGDQRYALDYLTRLGDTSFNRDTTLENQDLQRSYLDMQKEAAAQKLLTGVDQVENQGTGLANELGSAVAKREEASKQLGDLETYAAKLRQSSLVNPQYKTHITGVLAGIADKMTQAKRDLMVSDSDFKKATSQAINLGFIPQGDKIVHGRTGKAFNLVMPDNRPMMGPDVPLTVPAPVPDFAAQQSSNPAVNYFMKFFGDSPAPVNRVQNPEQSVQPAPPWSMGFPGGSAAPAAPQQGPATPQTPQEFSALPIGTLYVNPSNGAIYRKTR